MQYTSLDIICKNVILRKRTSLHFYLDCLLASVSILRELAFDDLQIINTKLLPLTSYNAIEIPNDCVDVLQVGIKVGQFVQPLVEDSRINSLNNFDANMNIIRYDENTATNQGLFYYGAIYGSMWWNTAHFDQYGGNIGRFYGKGDSNWNTYKIIPERNQIQINEQLQADNLVLQYISDGRNPDAATHIPPYAESTIEAYIFWQLKEHRRDISEVEKDRAKRAYLRERQILRARKNPLTIELLRKIIQKNQRQSIKS